MEEISLDQLNSMTYTKETLRKNTLDDAQLETRCPLDNGRFTDATTLPLYAVGQIDKLPAELLIEVMLYLDIPSLTRFRCLNRRAMDIVDSVREYALIIKHCPNVIRAILSIEADRFSCHALYKTLTTVRCSSCEVFGDHLYLIDCRRVCYPCFRQRTEYFPLTIGLALNFFPPARQQRGSSTTRLERLRAGNYPSVYSLPGRYCPGMGKVARKRLELFDRRALDPRLEGPGLPKVDKTYREVLRFMAIVSAPHLFDFGRQAD
ncbi:hypothetical protein F5Y14DRAFT_401069 [Nemania sp. NC0429]|nr:hypothetical protein F5Y14DRAFT_401069 [Nemania sp. NC0429]